MPYQDRGVAVSRKIYTLFTCLDVETYEEVAPKIEYWTEWAFSQQLTTVDKLVEHLSDLAWTTYRCPASFARFLRELRDSPRRSAQAKSFVKEFCARVFWWFAAASAEDLAMAWQKDTVAGGGGCGFVEAASFIGHLIEYDMLDHKLVRQHLVKPLTTHYYSQPGAPEELVRVYAVGRLFVAAGTPLLQGLLEPEDVRLCFKMLEIRLTRDGTTKLEELRMIHAAWLRREGREGEYEGGGKGKAVAGISPEVETLMAFTPKDPSTTINIAIPPPTLQLPTLYISTVSDSAPAEFDEGAGKDERIPTPHETLYLEDGNIEIVCGRTIFRVHSTIISFSSPNLRKIFSSSSLLNAPMPEGCPRVVFKDSAEDFAVLLKMVYTPGFPARNKVPEFTVFASLLRMTTKYGFSDIREALVEDIKGAYPTKLEDFETAKVFGEDIFGSPKPHPNAVLNLFLEHGIKSALPFAAYRAGLGGPSSLASEKPGTVLPRLTLASIIHGMGGMRRAMTYAAQTITYTWDLGACLESACVLNVGVGSAERGTETSKKISDALVKNSEGDMLASHQFGDIFCADCAKRLKNSDCRRNLVWARLPSLLGWESWEGV